LADGQHVTAGLDGEDLKVAIDPGGGLAEQRARDGVLVGAFVVEQTDRHADEAGLLSALLGIAVLVEPNSALNAAWRRCSGRRS